MNINLVLNFSRLLESVKFALIIAMSLISLLAQANQESSILLDKNQKKANTTTEPLRWNPGSDRISIQFKSKKDVGIKSIDLAAGHPNGMQFRAIYEDGLKPSIFIDWTEAKGCIDPTGGLKGGCFIDISLHDFDRDGIPEIVLSVGNGLIEQMVYVIQYHPPRRMQDRLRPENWTWNALEGQSQCFISGDSISFRIGSRGFTDTYFFRSGTFYRQRN